MDNKLRTDLNSYLGLEELAYQVVMESPVGEPNWDERMAVRSAIFDGLDQLREVILKEHLKVLDDGHSDILFVLGHMNRQFPVYQMHAYREEGGELNMDVVYRCKEAEDLVCDMIEWYAENRWTM